MKGASKCEPQFVFEFREGSLTLASRSDTPQLDIVCNDRRLG